MMNKIKSDVKAKLTPKRFQHTLGVCELAIKLAEHYGVNVEEAEMAALLHDYHKYASDEDILSTYDVLGLEVDEVIKNHPNLGHGLMSAVYAKNEYNCSEAVFLAIKNHTFGRKDMSMLEKILYVADALEVGRDYPGIEEKRQLMYKNLNLTILNVCESTLLYEIKRGNMIQVESIKMRNQLLEEL